MNTKNNYISLKNQTIISDNNMNGKIGKFIAKIEKGLDKYISRYIDVDYEKKKQKISGQKYCYGDHNNYSLETIQTDRGNSKGNTLSIYLKHTDIWVIDFDTFELDGCELYLICKKLNCPYTQTTKGYHYYVKIKNCGKFKNEQKVYHNPLYEIDLLHYKNNVWEDRTRENKGGDAIPDLDWNEIKHLFNVKRMNFEDKVVEPINLELPLSPVWTDSQEEEEVQEVQDEDIVLSTNLIPIEKLTKTVLKITDKYSYDDWLKVGFGIHTCSEGSTEGQMLFMDWSRKDKNCEDNGISALSKWEEFKNNTNQIHYGSLRIWAGEYDDHIETNPYKKSYHDNKMIEYMNKELKLCISSGLYIKIDEKEKTYYEHKKSDMANIYEQYNWVIPAIEDDDGNIQRKEKTIDPFKLWCKDINKSSIKKIIWNPDPKYNNIDYYNTFNSFDINREKVCDMYPKLDYKNDEEIAPLLEHIKHIICKDDDEKYDYFIKWLAHILQKPHIQTGVVIALQSVQGAGKGILFNDFLKPIIGYAASQLTKMGELTGQFNEILHKKVLININEAVWGGNKTDKGILKSIITEPKIRIEKKYRNPEEYDNYVNFLIDSNEDYIIPADDKERRYNLYKCNNKYGNMDLQNPERIEYFDKVRKCKPEKFAKFLYDLDITEFNPRKFKKTEELQEQVEMGWSPLIEWWYKYINEEGFKTKRNYHVYGKRTIIDENNVGIEHNGPKVINIFKKTKRTDTNIAPILIREDQWLYQDFFYENYLLSHVNKGYKLSKKQFWSDLQDKCTGHLELKKMTTEEGRRLVILLPPLVEVRKEFNIRQSHNYKWNDNMVVLGKDEMILDIKKSKGKEDGLD